MKHFCKKRFKGLALVLLFSLIIGNVPCAEAATPRLSKKRVSLKVGKTYRLRLRNATRKTIWKSTNKRVAIVNSKGRIKARKKGRAIIIAKNAGRTFKCRVIVRKKSKRSYSYSYVSKKPTANPATTAAVATSAATNAQKKPTATPMPTPTVNPQTVYDNNIDAIMKNIMKEGELLKDGETYFYGVDSGWGAVTDGSTYIGYYYDGHSFFIKKGSMAVLVNVKLVAGNANALVLDRRVITATPSDANLYEWSNDPSEQLKNHIMQLL